VRITIHNGARELRGNERQTLALAEGLAGRGHDIVVSCDPAAPLAALLHARGLRTTAVRPRGDLDLLASSRFAAWLHRERMDALLLTTWKRVPVGACGARLAGVRRIVVRLGIVRPLPARLHYRAAFRRCVDALIANSDEVAAAFCRSAPWFHEVHVIRNGVTPLPAADPTQSRMELGLPAHARLVAAAGGLETRKGYDLLLDAIALQGNDVHLAIAGTGPEAGALRLRAEALGISGRVHWLGQHDSIGTLLAAADVFAVSSRNEGTPVALLEAMGGPLLVATAVGGVAEVLAPRNGGGPAGWIVPPNDAQALATGLENALRVVRSDPLEASHRRAEARYRLEHWFTVDAMVERYERVLHGDVQELSAQPGN
jgi:glycosyltransferase involved in cell wall biosynthesis